MQGRTTPRVAALLFSAALFLASVGAAPALGALPRGYDVTRIGPDVPGAPFGVGNRVGDSLVNAGDLNGDGKDDIVAGSPSADGGKGLVYKFSGADGALIGTIPPPRDGGESGSQCNNATDDDGDGKVNDGCPAVGAPESGAQCDNTTDDDADTPPKVNDGCPIVGGGQPVAWGTYVGKIADTGSGPDGFGFSCPGFGTAPSEGPGIDCNKSIAQMDAGDSVPDLLVTAPGADVTPAANDDTGRAYVVDGKTGAIMKRIDMPVNDRTAEAAVAPSANLKAGAPGSGAKPAFGGAALIPAGQPPCSGNAGIKPCGSVSAGVKVGDLNGGGGPDFVIAAPDYYETSGAGSLCPSTCAQSGRVYIYFGESLRDGRGPGQPLASAFALSDPVAQGDDPNQPAYTYPESFGQSLSPVGDLGTCTLEEPTGPYCPDAATTHDLTSGRPDFVISAPRTDTFGLAESGIAFLFDGGGDFHLITKVLTPPDPQMSAIFGFNNSNQPALGDVAGNGFPDMYQPAILQDVEFRAQGRGYVFNGDLENDNASNSLLGVLDDPTPSKIGNFGTSSAGVGNVAGGEAGLDSRNEIMVGAVGPEGGPTGGFEGIVNVFGDVSIFSPLTDQALQIVSNPDDQSDTAFGGALAPLGDLNGDQMLDFAVGAGGYGSEQGRIYIFTSDDSVQPPPSSSPPPPGSTGPPAGSQGNQVISFAGRTLELEASRSRVKKGRGVQLKGLLESFANPNACQSGQRVFVQRRRPGKLRYTTFTRATTNGDGEFVVTTKVRRTYFYRAWVGETSACLGAISQREKVSVKGKKSAKR